MYTTAICLVVQCMHTSMYTIKVTLAFSAKALIYLSKALIITKYDKRQRF